MTNWRAYESVGGRYDLSRINRRIQLKYPGTDVAVTPAEFGAAQEAAQLFLTRQRGPGDTSFLQQENGASIQFYPKDAKGRFCVEIGSIGNGGTFGTVTPMSREFQVAYSKSKDPVWVEATVSQRLEMRNQRLGIPYERSTRLTLSGQHESISLQEEPTNAVEQPQRQQQRGVAICY